ncbi:MAG: carboxypeptidase-like regulatory domain-containing protein [Gemmatimonadaceae bacterium]
MRESPLRTAWIGAVAALLAAGPAHGQVIRGALRSQFTARPVERARVTAVDRTGRVVGETIANDSGNFTLRVDARSVPFSLTVRRIGIEPSTTPEFELTPADTVDFELNLPETPILGDTVRITGMASYNETKYQEAVRRGWKVFPPAEVAKHRDRVNSVYDLLRWADASLMIPSRRNECVRSARYLAGDRRADRCMVWIVDGQVLGPLPILNPADTYFIAVLTASQSAVQFGDRAPWGAIVLYTRMNGDRLHP